MNLSIYNILFTFVLATASLGLNAQDNCFQSLKKQGNDALNQADYATAIQSFQSIIRNCDKATQSQRSEALSLLNNAYDLNEAALKASIKRAEDKAEEAKVREEEAIIERKAKEKEAINAQSSKIAFHASEETDKLAKLTLAYYSKKWLANIDTFSQSSNIAFGDAVQERYKRVESSQKGFINAATLIKNDVLVKGVNGAISIKGTKKAKTFIAHQNHILTIAPFKDGFITTSKDKSVKYWVNETKNEAKFILTGHEDIVNGVAISPDESFILTYSKDKTAKLWNTNGQELATLEGHTGAIYDAIISSDGQYILTRSKNNEVGFWDKQGKLIVKKSYDTFVYDMAISDNGHLIISTNADGQIHLWNKQGKTISKKAHDKAVFKVEITHNNQYFLTTGADKKVKLWDNSGNVLQSFTSTSSIIYANFIAGQNKIVIAAGKEVAIYDFSGKKEQIFDHEALVSSIKVAPNGQYFLAGTYDNIVKLWSVNGFELLSLNPFNDQVIGLDFSATGDYILAYSQDGVIAMCPTPDYIYQQLESKPPVITQQLKDKYGIK